MMLAIECSSLGRAYGGDWAVRGLDLRVPERSIFGFLGLNGAGKSTTIKILATLILPTEGRASIFGQDVIERALDVRGTIGVVHGDASEGAAWWTAEEYIGYFARLRGLPDPRAATSSVLERVGFETAWRRRPIAAYSTGMKRRLEIARATLGDPRLLLLDEPTTGIDLPTKHALWELFRSLQRDLGVTIFLSSHDASEIRALTQQVAILSGGRLVYDGGPAGIGTGPDEFERNLVSLLTQGRGTLGER